jgi:hypothetical protein
VASDQSLFLSADHLAALVVTAAVCAALPVVARARPGAWTARLSRTLAAALLAWVWHTTWVVSLRGL